jgi:hypothetical protein
MSVNGTDGIVHYDVTRIALIEALGSIPLGEKLLLEARGRVADALLAQMPVAETVTEERCREIMQATLEAGEQLLLAHVAAATDERLEQSVGRVRVGIAAAIAAEKIPCAEHPMPFPKPSCWQCGRNGAFNRAALIAAGKFGVEEPQP